MNNEKNKAIVHQLSTKLNIPVKLIDSLERMETNQLIILKDKILKLVKNGNN